MPELKNTVLTCTCTCMTYMSDCTHVPMAVFTFVVKLERNVLLARPDPTVNAWAGQFCFLVTFGILSSSSNSCIQGDPVHAGLYLPPWPTMHVAQGGQHQLCSFVLFDSSPWKQKPSLQLVSAKAKLWSVSKTAITPISDRRVTGYSGLDLQQWKSTLS